MRLMRASRRVCIYQSDAIECVHHTLRGRLQSRKDVHCACVHALCACVRVCVVCMRVCSVCVPACAVRMRAKLFASSFLVIENV